MTDAFRTVLSDEEHRSEHSTGAQGLALENTWTDQFEDLLRIA
jgi:hypothetical protein